MFLWLHTMALDKQTQHEVTGLQGTWQKLEHRAAARLWAAPVTRALARVTHPSLEATLSRFSSLYQGEPAARLALL